MISNEYAPKGALRNLEFLVRKQKEENDVELVSIKQDSLTRLKNVQDDMSNRIEAKEVVAIKLN